MSKFIPTEKLVTLIKAHAEANYNKGWDEVYEAWDDEDITDVIGLAYTLKGALKRMQKVIKLRKEYGDEIRATAF